MYQDAHAATSAAAESIVAVSTWVFLKNILVPEHSDLLVGLVSIIALLWSCYSCLTPARESIPNTVDGDFLTLLLYVSFQQHLLESLETRLNALEESSSLAQKQLGMALATAEELRSSNLPAQVLSLHTEMKTRLAEMQRATVPLEQLSQLQTTLKGKSEEFEVVRSQVDGLAALSLEVSHKVEVLTGSLREAESKLDERAGQATTLSGTLDAQVVLVHSLKEQVEMCQGQLEARAHDIASVRLVVAPRVWSRGGNNSPPLTHNALLTLSKPQCTVCVDPRPVTGNHVHPSTAPRHD